MAGIGHNSKKERNLELYHDFISGSFTGMQLALKYGVTPQRVYQIATRQEELATKDPLDK